MKPSKSAHSLAGVWRQGAATLGAAAVGAASLAGCSAATVAAPDDAIDAWVSAVERGNWDRAWELLSQDGRRGRSQAEFRQWAAANADALRAEAEGLRVARESKVAAVRAWIPLDAAHDVELTWSDGRWFLAENMPLLGGADTPMQAMSAVAALIESPELESLLRVMGPSLRARYEAELSALSAALIAGAGQEVVVNGDTATVSIDELTFRLVRVDGAWMLDGINQLYDYNNYDYYDW